MCNIQYSTDYWADYSNEKSIEVYKDIVQCLLLIKLLNIVLSILSNTIYIVNWSL